VIPDSIFDLACERKYQRFIDIQNELYKELKEFILGSVLQGDYLSVMLVSMLGIVMKLRIN